MALDPATPAAKSIMREQTLLIDADDTLWENNIYFERAIASFISYLDHRVHTREEVREHLNTCERSTIEKYGYGVQSFRRSLVDCFEQLSDGPLTTEKHTRIVAFTESISAQEIELLAGVKETLKILHARQTLLLVTKGSTAEQMDKLARSGLSPFFSGTEVLSEKHEAAYEALVRQHGFEAERTWMIGNSPRSDINPALAAGLNAVFIPHDFTWALEHESIDRPKERRCLLELGNFAELVNHF